MFLNGILILFGIGVAIWPILFDLKTGNQLNKYGIIFFCFCAGLGIITFLKESKVSDEENNYKITVSKSQAELANLSQQLKQKNDSIRIVMYQNTDSLKKRIEYLRNDNEFLSKQLSKTSIETVKNVVGDGYCIFEVWGSNDLNNAYAGALRSKSNYPIYDVSYLIYDYDSVYKCPAYKKANLTYVDLNCFELYSIAGKIATLPKNVYNYVEYSFLSKQKHKTFEIKIHTRNASYHQLAIYELKRGFCRKSYKLYRFDGPNISLVEYVNELNLTNEEWEKAFFPIDKIMVYKK